MPDPNFDTIYSLKCRPNHDSMTIYAYFTIHENVNPALKGMIFRVPGVVEVYTKPATNDSFYFHIDFVGKDP
jgi:hypothetical protein